VVRADPTDLLAMPALGLDWWAWRRSQRGNAQARLAATLVVLPIARLAVAAPPKYDDAVALRESGDIVLVGIDKRQEQAHIGRHRWGLHCRRWTDVPSPVGEIRCRVDHRRTLLPAKAAVIGVGVPGQVNRSAAGSLR
jgi:hypothetical protein